MTPALQWCRWQISGVSVPYLCWILCPGLEGQQHGIFIQPKRSQCNWLLLCTYKIVLFGTTSIHIKSHILLDFNMKWPNYLAFTWVHLHQVKFCFGWNWQMSFCTLLWLFVCLLHSMSTKKYQQVPKNTKKYTQKSTKKYNTTTKNN